MGSVLDVAPVEAQGAAQAAPFRPSAPSIGPLNIYFGWYNAVFSLISIMLVVGTTSYCFGLFVKPASEELGLSRATMNLGLIMFYVGSAVYNPIIGRLLDRVPIKIIYRSGVALFGLGMCGVGLTSSPVIMALLIAGPIALGTIGSGSIFGIVLISRWFSDKRGRAIAIVALGTSFGGMVVFPVVAALMQHAGWRATLVISGLAIGVGLMIMSFFIRVRPDEATAAQLAERAPIKHSAISLTPRQILAEPNFWFIAVPVALMLAVDQSMLATVTPYMLDRGMTLGAAAGIMSATTASAIAGKLLIAWIADRSDLRVLLGITAVFGIILCSVLMMDPGYGGILAVSLLTGLAIGGTYPLGSAILVQLFGAPSVGTALGLKLPLVSIFAMIALYFVGATHDRTGSYHFAFGVFAVTCLVAMCLLPLIRRLPSGGARLAQEARQ